MSIPVAWPQVLAFFGTPLIMEPSQGLLSGDAGLFPTRSFGKLPGVSAPMSKTAMASKLVSRLTHKTFFDSTEFPVNVQTAARFQFDFFQPLPIQIQVSDAPLTLDAGLLPLRQFDQRIGQQTSRTDGPPRSVVGQGVQTAARVGRPPVTDGFPADAQELGDLGFSEAQFAAVQGAQAEGFEDVIGQLACVR